MWSGAMRREAFTNDSTCIPHLLPRVAAEFDALLS
jgi:hypothetical protein